MKTCPLCGKRPLVWEENEIRAGYACKPCGLWIRITKDAEGGPLIDMSVTERGWEEIKDRMAAWWTDIEWQELVR